MSTKFAAADESKPGVRALKRGGDKESLQSFAKRIADLPWFEGYSRNALAGLILKYASGYDLKTVSYLEQFRELTPADKPVLETIWNDAPLVLTASDTIFQTLHATHLKEPDMQAPPPFKNAAEVKERLAYLEEKGFIERDSGGSYYRVAYKFEEAESTLVSIGIKHAPKITSQQAEFAGDEQLKGSPLLSFQNSITHAIGGRDSQDRVPEFWDPGNILIVIGPKGAGKTHGTLQALRKFGISYTYHSFKFGSERDMEFEGNANYRNSLDEGEIKFIERQVHVNVFDDIGYLVEEVEKGNITKEKATEYLKKAISADNGPSIVISNTPLSSLEGLDHEFYSIADEIESRRSGVTTVETEMVSQKEYERIAKFYSDKFNFKYDYHALEWIYETSSSPRFLIKVMEHYDGNLTVEKLDKEFHIKQEESPGDWPSLATPEFRAAKVLQIYEAFSDRFLEAQESSAF